MKIEEIVGLDQRLGELRKISRSLHRLSECSCNYGLTDRQEKRKERLEKKAVELGKELGFKVYFQGDPRGCALYLVPPELADKEAESTYPSYFAIY